MMGSGNHANGNHANGDTAIDIVVATRNRPSDLKRFIPTVLDQDHRNFRLIIIDQSQDPKPNAELVQSFKDDRLVYLVQGGKGKSRALNLGLSRATAPILAFTDDDCTLPTNWLSQALACFSRNERAGIAFGNVIAAQHDEREWFIPAIEIDSFRSFKGPLSRSHGLIGMGANMFARKRVFDQIGLFDEDLGPGGPLLTGEECELTYRALQHGLEVVREPSLSVTHWGARPVSGDIAKELVNSGFFAVGAGYGKHIRAGDKKALAIMIHETAWVSALIARAIVTNTRPFHIRRLGYLWRGVAVGFRYGVFRP
jgi:glycosyltransferase involved in cell wall biosynthesis